MPISLYTVLKLLHVIVAFWFVAGVIGRELTFRQARRETDLRLVTTLLALSDRFERMMVIPGSSLVLLLGLFTAWSVGMPILGFLQNYPSNWVLLALILYVISTINVFAVLAPKRKQRHALTEEAAAQGSITLELSAALNDSTVINARRVEYVLLIAIIALMVLKPF